MSGIFNIQRFVPDMKMAEMVEIDFHLLEVFSRMGLGGSFGERTVEQVCTDCGLDPHTFTVLCSVYSSASFVPTEEDIAACKAEDVAAYLHSSHIYYRNVAIPALAEKFSRLIAPCSAPQQAVLGKFLTDYKEELDKHFSDEENEVLPYVSSLLAGEDDEDLSIDSFEDNHEGIEEKLGDFKNIVMKSLPRECDDTLRSEFLNFLFLLQKDFDGHTRIEDDVLVPVVRKLEEPVKASGSDRKSRTELSDREKEILVSVAQGLLNKEIADKHNISVHTVISHRKNITRKTGIKTVSGLTVYALLNGLLDINSIE